jgi:hypothetical protein
MARSMRRALLAIVVAAAFALGGCFIVESFGDYVIDGGADARTEGSLDASLDAAKDAPAEGCTADLSSDPLNCGKCGHACGAGCEGGHCTAVELISGLRYPSGVVALPTVVYVAEDAKDGGVYMWTEGTDGGFAFATHQLNANRIAVPTSKAFVYWTASDGVWMCPAPTGKEPCNPTSVGPTTGKADRVIVGDDGALYWTVEDNNEVWRQPLTDGGEPVGDAAVFAQGAPFIQPLALHSTQVSLLVSTIGPTDGGVDGGGTIQRLTLDSMKPPYTVVDGLQNPRSIAGATDTLLWTGFGFTGASTGVFGCEFESGRCQGSPTTCYSIGGAESVIAGGASAYFSASGGVFYMPLPPGGGCYSASELKVQRLAQDPNFPRDISQYGGFLYWTDYVADGGLFRVAEPSAP